ncbi:MAG: hypothetical protein U5N55_05110 [Cypionkella sp.]|nr:hypothetical protein [Cypionkella sp.]
MSEVLHAWVIAMQDAVPDGLRNDGRLAAFIPLLAGTNDGRDKVRLGIILEHMWSVTLPAMQPGADKCGFGAEWALMCKDKTVDAAYAAADAADAVLMPTLCHQCRPCPCRRCRSMPTMLPPPRCS